MAKYLCLIIVALIVISCDDDSGPSTPKAPQWFYITRDFNSSNEFKYVSRIDINSGDSEILVDSAMVHGRQYFGKVAYVKQTLKYINGNQWIVKNVWVYDDADKTHTQLTNDDYEGVCRAYITHDGCYVAIITDDELSTIRLSDGFENVFVQGNSVANIYFLAFCPVNTEFAFVMDNMIATYDFESRSLQACYHHEEGIENQICYNETGEKIIAIVTDGGVEKLISYDINDNTVDTLDSGKDFIAPVCPKLGDIVYGEYSVVQDSLYAHEQYDLWTISLDGYKPRILLQGIDHGYTHFAHHPFDEYGDLLAGKMSTTTLGKRVQLVAIIMDTGVIRGICSDCLE